MENKWLKIIVHASPIYAPILVPLLFLLLINDDEVKSISLQALLFQIVMFVLITIAAVMSIFIIGIPFLIVFIGMTIIVPIIGIVKALSDQDWQYPIVGRWM